jgi:hypothetical protein
MTYGDFLKAAQQQDIPTLNIDGSYWGGVLQAKDIDMESFATKLSTNRTLTSLTLNRTKHTTAAAKQLAEALLTNNTLTSLALRGNKIQDGGVIALAATLKVNTTLKSLEISAAGLSAAGIKELSFALQLNRSLEHLDLRGNFEGVTDAGVKSLAAVLGNTSLTSLDLSHSNVGPAGITYLAEALATNRTLKTLLLQDLRKVAFVSGKGLDSFAALCAALVRNATLTSIDLSLVRLEKEAVQFLEAVLPMNITLLSLTVGDASPGKGFRELMSKVKQPRQKIENFPAAELPPAIAAWLDMWTTAATAAAAAGVAVSASPAGPKKRKRMTEADRLRAAME